MAGKELNQLEFGTKKRLLLNQVVFVAIAIENRDYELRIDHTDSLVMIQYSDYSKEKVHNLISLEGLNTSSFSTFETLKKSKLAGNS